MIGACIMAGGQGERFWPASRRKYPKQFLPLLDGKSPLQETVARLEALIPLEQTYVVTTESYAEQAREQLPELPEENLILEPVGRNTAACIGLAAVVMAERLGGDAVMAVLPADHWVRPVDAFQEVLTAAMQAAAQDDWLVTLGIRPSRPETGYGYIRHGSERLLVNGAPAYLVEAFVEKPSRERAQRYLSDGRYLWNSGIFAWRVATILDQLQRHLPEIHEPLEAVRPAVGTPRFWEVVQRVYPGLPAISIDYGVMERAERILVFPGSFAWDDLGSWPALTRVFPTDAAGNLTRGKVVLEDVRGSIVHANGKLIAALGVKDLVVVETEEAILVCERERAQELRRLVERIAEEGYESYL
ncbi:mannose-1-phosphate guanylyltransferase [Limnochorda pilosa]|uniref:mannose-1-phosphate guanylyltransferase n=1 Tax=Limnochorda pilosa TaxID=1555112 RepID=A0A0K2SP31_LIMPI|nr:mannose-1-phosphate guanylyltransferase [Limnochorda pilosa]BAS28861.1 mannose-1-phosphate guanylyltransferase [Limnochorda pilosa]